MSKASDILNKGTGAMTEWGELISGLIDAAGPQYSLIKNSVMALVARMRKEDLLNEADEAALTAKQDERSRDIAGA